MDDVQRKYRTTCTSVLDFPFCSSKIGTNWPHVAMYSRLVVCPILLRRSMYSATFGVKLPSSKDRKKLEARELSDRLCVSANHQQSREISSINAKCVLFFMKKKKFIIWLHRAVHPAAWTWRLLNNHSLKKSQPEHYPPSKQFLHRFYMDNMSLSFSLLYNDKYHPLKRRE